MLSLVWLDESSPWSNETSVGWPTPPRHGLSSRLALIFLDPTCTGLTLWTTLFLLPLPSQHPPSNRDGAVAQLAALKKAREQARLEANHATTSALNQGMTKIRAAREGGEGEETTAAGKLGMRERRVQMDGLLGGSWDKERTGFWGVGGGGEKTPEKMV